ncbi:M15 family metallopeptidase [Aminobacter sp. BE322]|uniref:M15 family metallopeptidase n=1 Tax=unclassified Aminobacter TaxID=2644704 RepID=UPI003D1EE31F
MAGEFDFSRFAVGGAQRADSFSGMQPAFRSALAQMFQAAPPEIQQNLRFSSGFRSPQRQAELWQGALAKYGSPEAARKWVAPPGRSQHGHGNAADVKYLAPAALKWAHANAAQFGLSFPLSNENWHIELAGARGQKHGAPASAAQMMAQGRPSLAQSFVEPQAAPGGLGAVIPGAEGAGTSPNFGALASMFAQQQADRRRQREEEAAAEQVRREALLGGSLANLYG